MLCPPICVTLFSARIRRELRDEITTVKHTAYPPFMYRDYEINPDDLLDGLFESSVLLKVSRQ